MVSLRKLRETHCVQWHYHVFDEMYFVISLRNCCPCLPKYLPKLPSNEHFLAGIWQIFSNSSQKVYQSFGSWILYILFYYVAVSLLKVMKIMLSFQFFKGRNFFFNKARLIYYRYIIALFYLLLDVVKTKSYKLNIFKNERTTI